MRAMEANEGPHTNAWSSFFAGEECLEVWGRGHGWATPSTEPQLSFDQVCPQVHLASSGKMVMWELVHCCRL